MDAKGKFHRMGVAGHSPEQPYMEHLKREKPLSDDCKVISHAKTVSLKSILGKLSVRLGIFLP